MFLFLDQLLNQLSSLEMPPLASVLTSGASFFIIFGGLVPFMPQYWEIKQTGNAEGFSTLVCFTLLLANILRILFWFGHRFELPLLLQSIVMIGVMLAMVHLCTAVRQRAEIIPVKKHKFVDFEWRHFWNWTDFKSYIQCLVTIALGIGLLTYLLIDNHVYIESLGFLAVLAEAMLGAPQFYRNFQNKSTKGMSIQMVLFWLLGDVFKTLYFILRRAPSQFWLCGMLQIGLDLSILTQVAYYGSSETSSVKVT